MINTISTYFFWYFSNQLAKRSLKKHGKTIKTDIHSVHLKREKHYTKVKKNIKNMINAHVTSNLIFKTIICPWFLGKPKLNLHFHLFNYLFIYLLRTGSNSQMKLLIKIDLLCGHISESNTATLKYVYSTCKVFSNYPSNI